MAANRTIALETTEASITTVAVTIKALQVGKKQMTQSIFRQLPEAPLIDEAEVLLTGVPWGHVRYFWDGKQGRHFVFQQGEALKRCPFVIRYSGEFNFSERDPKRSVVIRRRDNAMARARLYTQILQGILPEPIPTGSLTICGCIEEFDVALPENFVWLYSSIGDAVEKEGMVYLPAKNGKQWMTGADCRDRLLGVQRDLRGFFARELSRVWPGEPPDIEQIRGRMASVEAEWDDYCRRWNELMERLESVEQLFIAV